MLLLNEWMCRHVAANDNVTVVQFDANERIRSASVMPAPDVHRFIVSLGIGSYPYEPYSDALVEPDKNDKLLFSAMDGASVLVQQPERIIEL